MADFSSECKDCAWYNAKKDFCNRQKLFALRRPGCGFRPARVERWDRPDMDIRRWLP